MLLLPLLLAGPPGGPAAAARPEADYILPRTVSGLIVYDETQQPVLRADRAGIVPGAPLRILNPDDRMSDGITPCMRVSLAGRTLFLIRTGSAGDESPEGAAGSSVIRGATVIDDTVQVLSPSTVRFLPPGQPPSEIPAGTRIERAFRDGKRLYGRLLKGGPYGWFETNPGADPFAPAARAAPSPPSREKMVGQVRRHIEEANRLMLETYRGMERQTGRRLPVPRWELAEDGNGVTCILRNVTSPSHHRESTALLARAIGHSLRPSGFTVTDTPGRIVIR